MSQRILFVLLLGTACRPAADRLAHGKWVDLTYPFDSTTIYWPTAEPFRRLASRWLWNRKDR